MTADAKLSYTINEAWKLAYSLPEAAALCDRPLDQVKAWTRSGLLESFYLGGKQLVRADVLRAFRPPPTDLGAVRLAPACGVYLLSHAGALVYVGRSTNLRSRLAAHRRSERGFDDIRIIECDPEVAAWLEAELIRVLNPPQNLIRYSRRTRDAERQQRRRGLQ